MRRPRGAAALVVLAAVAVALPLLAACRSAPADDGDLAARFGEARVVLRGEGRTAELHAYVADTPSLRRQGLMGWESLPPGTGMLFVFDADSRSGFWMKDTSIPLSIAFADADGRIHTVLDMAPCASDPCPTYHPEEPYRHAFEVEQGVFEEVGVAPGWTLTVEDAPAWRPPANSDSATSN